jgi:hypothetical protein
MKDEDRGRNPKGSWEEAAAEYRRCWMEQFGVGFFSFDSPDDKRIEEPVGNTAVQNARTSFRTLLTLAFRGSLDHQVIYPFDLEKPPYTVPQFRPKSPEDAAAGSGLLAEFILQFFSTDGDDYFAELLRLRKKLPDLSESRTGIDSLPMKMALYCCARDLAKEKGSDPTRAEVIDRLDQTTKHRPHDPGSLFDGAKLAFLKDNRGRPKKRNAKK